MPCPVLEQFVSTYQLLSTVFVCGGVIKQSPETNKVKEKDKQKIFQEKGAR